MPNFIFQERTLPYFYLSICAIFRNESKYLIEWIEFHIRQGVQHFYLYDNNSEDDPRLILNPFLEKGIVTLKQWPIPYTEGAQLLCYQDCLSHFGSHSRWIGFIDIDEFLFHVELRLDDALIPYEKCPSLTVHWQCFGSSGHEQDPEGGILSNFLYRAPTNWIRNRRVKQIVDPARSKCGSSPHYFVHSEKSLSVNELFESVSPRPANRFLRRIMRRFPLIFLRRFCDPYAVTVHQPKRVSVEKFRINHYVLRSAASFQEKKMRSGNKKYKIGFFSYHDRNDVYDNIILKK